jgi:pimeloyl-ACP methyl ester carboxylesterase
MVTEESPLTGFAPVPNGRLHYELAGSGDPVVLVHGNSGDRRHWDLQFDEFARRFLAVRYDARGFGHSSVPVEGQPYSHYEDLATLLDYLAIDRAHLVGWSMGSGIVFDCAVAHPDRVRSIVSVGSWVSGYSSPAAKSMLDDLRHVRAAMKTGGHQAAVDAWMDSPFFRDGIAERAAGERFRTIAKDYTFWHFAHRDPQQPVPGAVTRLAEVRVPVLLLAGEHDVPLFLEIADMLASTLPRARKLTIAGGGHLVHMERPNEFNQAVVAFLRTVRE